MYRNIIARIVGVGLALPLAFGGVGVNAYASETPYSAGDVQAGDGSTRGAVGHYSKVVKKSKKRYTNTKNEIASCKAGTTMTCTINKTAGATRTIDAGLGLSRGAVAGNLGISKAKSQSVGVSCSSRVKKGHRLVAYPVGTRYKYKIEKHITTPIDYKDSTSGWKYAFDPAPAKVACKVK